MNDSNKLEIPKTYVYTGEAFAYDIHNKEYVVHSEIDCLRGCFGNFTHHYTVHRDKPFSCTFRYYFRKIVDDTCDQKYLMDINAERPSTDTGRIRNALYIGSNRELQADIEWLYDILNQYVPFNVWHNTTLKDWRYNNYCINHTNYSLVFDFKDCLMYEVFFVLTTFRRLMQLTSRPYYRLAQKLAKEKWHNLSFINILLLLDNTDINIPVDQKIGFHMFNPEALYVTPQSFKDNKSRLALNSRSLHECIVPLKRQSYTFFRNMRCILKPNSSDNILDLQFNMDKLEELYELLPDSIKNQHDDINKQK